jgi:DNA recombination protein Rad52
MGFTTEQIDMLDSQLDASVVRQRKQAGRMLSYIEAWWAIHEANRIFGYDAWDRETLEMIQVTEPEQNEKGNWVVAYRAKVRVTVRAGDCVIAREGTGYGEGINRLLGQAHESAIKEAESDAMKRALMTFGSPFGLALYDKDQRDVSTNPVSKRDARPVYERLQKTLRACQSVAALKEWSENHADEIQSLPEDWKAILRKEWKEAHEFLNAETDPHA